VRVGGGSVEVGRSVGVGVGESVVEVGDWVVGVGVRVGAIEVKPGDWFVEVNVGGIEVVPGWSVDVGRLVPTE
jgi:hypothetical protein